MNRNHNSKGRFTAGGGKSGAVGTGAKTPKKSQALRRPQ